MAHPSVWPGLYKPGRPQSEPDARRKAPGNNEHRNQYPNKQYGTRENRNGAQEVKRAGIVAVPTPTWSNVGDQKRYPDVEERHRKHERCEQENTDVLARNLQHLLITFS